MPTAVPAAAAGDACLGLISRRGPPHPVPNACPEGWGQAESQGRGSPTSPARKRVFPPSRPRPGGGGEPLGDGWGSQHVCFPRGPSSSVPSLISGWDPLTSCCYRCMSSASRVGGSPKVSQPDSAPETHLSLLPTPSHPRAFAQAVMGRFRQVPAMCPWRGYSLLGLRSLLVI